MAFGSRSADSRPRPNGKRLSVTDGPRAGGGPDPAGRGWVGPSSPRAGRSPYFGVIGFGRHARQFPTVPARSRPTTIRRCGQPNREPRKARDPGRLKRLRDGDLPNLRDLGWPSERFARHTPYQECEVHVGLLGSEHLVSREDQSTHLRGEAGFFLELPDQGRFEGLPRVDEPAGEGESVPVDRPVHEGLTVAEEYPTDADSGVWRRQRGERLPGHVEPTFSWRFQACVTAPNRPSCRSGSFPEITAPSVPCSGRTRDRTSTRPGSRFRTRRK